MDPCDGIYLGSLSFFEDGNDIGIDVMNYGFGDRKIVGIFFDWAPGNDELKFIELHPASTDPKIWDRGDEDSPTDIPSEGGWRSGGDRYIPMGWTKMLTFFFSKPKPAEPYDYFLKVRFDNGCTRTFPDF